MLEDLEEEITEVTCLQPWPPHTQEKFNKVFIPGVEDTDGSRAEAAWKEETVTCDSVWPRPPSCGSEQDQTGGADDVSLAPPFPAPLSASLLRLCI